MTQKLNILVLNCQEIVITDKETGEVNEMTKISYGIVCSDSPNFSGYSILESYVNDKKAFAIAKKYCGKVVESTIKMRALKNGVKYIITSLNNESFE